MSKKIFLSPSNQNGNRYAYGNTTEDVQCGRIAVACKSALERCGFEVKLEQYDTMQNRVAHSNAWKADMHVAIHTNATEKHTAGGTQVYYYAANGYGNVAAKAVFDELKTITPGSNAEVYKKYSTLYEVRATKATAVYIEAEFHDVPEYAKWIIEHVTDLGEAICKGICKYYGVKYVAPKEEITEDEKPAVSSPIAYESIKPEAELDFRGTRAYATAESTVGVKVSPSRVKVTHIYLKSSAHPIHVRSVNSDHAYVPGVYGWVDLKDLYPVEDTSFLVKVTASSLNIRTGPSTSYKIVGSIKDQGVYTIEEVQNGWGKLKSKLGWICLDYTKRI